MWPALPAQPIHDLAWQDRRLDRAGLGLQVWAGPTSWPQGQADKQLDGTVVASVRPEQVPIADEPLAGCDGATSIILFQMDVIHGLTVSEIHPDAVTTAYGPLEDFVAIAKGEAPAPAQLPSIER